MHLVRLGDGNSSDEDEKGFHQSMLLEKSDTSKIIISTQFPEPQTSIADTLMKSITIK